MGARVALQVDAQPRSEKEHSPCAMEQNILAGNCAGAITSSVNDTSGTAVAASKPCTRLYSPSLRVRVDLPLGRSVRDTLLIPRI